MHDATMNDYPQRQLDTGKNADEIEPKKHTVAAFEAVFVTILWSSSWVIIKFGLEELPPLTFSGLRYSLASIILLVIIFSKSNLKKELRTQSRSWWVQMLIYGVIFVTITQGAQFVGLDLLPAITVSLFLNLTPILVVLLGFILLRERPDSKQAFWIIIGFSGVIIYFQPWSMNEVNPLGLLIVSIGVLANAISAVMGRAINKESKTSPWLITGVSMSFGSLILIVSGILLEDIQSLSPLSMFYIIWLSVVNTAFAFTIWNNAMRTLRAMDISIINGTMLPQIVLLSILFLGELPDFLEIGGLILVGLGALMVQLNQIKRNSNSTND